MSTFVIATRKSPLALAQAELVRSHLQSALPGTEFSLLPLTTTGDKQLEWSLEKQGGKGLFTAEIEQSLRDGHAHIAVHSAKDLPGENTDASLAIAGYLPRADAHDVLIIREGIAQPSTIATSSPRRRLQLARVFPSAAFTEIRGNVATRLRKIVEGQADATVLARAGLDRLGITSFPGVRFETLPFEKMVPAVAQAAIAIQCRGSDVAKFAPHFDAATATQIAYERAFQSLLGGGCQVAFAAHADTEGQFWIFHERCGHQRTKISGETPEKLAENLLTKFGLRA